MKKLNATAVVPLTPANVEFLRKIQMNQPIPEGANYIAFLEDGDATFIFEELPVEPGRLMLPMMHLLSFYENIAIEFE